MNCQGCIASTIASIGMTKDQGYMAVKHAREQCADLRAAGLCQVMQQSALVLDMRPPAQIDAHRWEVTR